MALHNRLVVVDIDDTVSTDNERRHLRPHTNLSCLAGVKIDSIYKYMDPSLVRMDKPIVEAIEPLNAISAKTHMVFLTSRWDLLRQTTIDWFAEHMPDVRYRALLMRPMNDVGKPAADYKIDKILDYLANAGEYLVPSTWYDDDVSVLSAAQRAGFVAVKAPEVWHTGSELNILLPTYQLKANR